MGLRFYHCSSTKQINTILPRNSDYQILPVCLMKDKTYKMGFFKIVHTMEH